MTSTLRSRPEGRGPALLVTLALGVLVVVPDPGAANPVLQGPLPVDLQPIPVPDGAGLEPAVLEQLRDLETAVADLVTSPPPDRKPEPLVGAAFGDLGRAYHAYELWDAASAAYSNAARLLAAEPRWLYLAAVVEQERGRPEIALELLDRVLSLWPRFPAAHVRAGELLLESGRASEADEHFSTVLAAVPTSAASWAGRGQVALSERRWDDAVEAFEKALELAPSADRLHHPLGLAWRGLGNTEKALEHLSIRGDVGVREADPDVDGVLALRRGERVHRLRGQLAYRVGRWEEAIEAFRAAVEESPDSVPPRIDLAAALGAAGRPDEAIELLQGVVDDAPENATAAFNLGALLRASGRPEGAAEALSRVVELEPEDVTARVELGRALREAGRPLEALDAFRRGLAVRPEHAEARLEAVGTLLSFGRTREALAVLEEGVEIDPGSGSLTSALARLLAAGPELELRDGARAVQLAERVLGGRAGSFEKETMALALAEAGRCRDASDWQLRAAAAALDEGDRERADHLRKGLCPLDEEPCRPPASDSAG